MCQCAAEGICSRHFAATCGSLAKYSGSGTLRMSSQSIFACFIFQPQKRKSKSSLRQHRYSLLSLFSNESLIFKTRPKSRCPKFPYKIFDVRKFNISKLTKVQSSKQSRDFDKAIFLLVTRYALQSEVKRVFCNLEEAKKNLMRFIWGRLFSFPHADLENLG